MAIIRNPQNGYYIETGIGTNIGFFFLGPLMFLFKGAYAQFCITLILMILLGWTFIVPVGIWIGLIFFGPKVIENAYARKGWDIV